MVKRSYPSLKLWSAPFALRIATAALLLQVFCDNSSTPPVLAFVPSLSPMRCCRMADCLLDISEGPRRIQQRSFTHTTQATSNPTEDTTAAAELYDTATQLLGRLLEQRNQDIETPFQAFLNRNTPSYQQRQTERKTSIEALIEKLTFATLGEPAQQQNQQAGGGGLQSFLDRLKPQPTLPSYYYDPSVSLFGCGFYCTLYFYYPNSASDSSGKPPEDPIWEKTSLKASNIKGQQYYIRNDFQQSVINYSEVLGPKFTISAEGVLTPIDEKGNKGKEQKQQSPTDNQIKKDSRSLRKLPDVYRVDATKISASIFGFDLDFKIEGSANLVVLYADPRIRVFVSPLPSETVVGNWEEAGLVVVQVRGDLVPAENESMPQIIDLR